MNIIKKGFTLKHFVNKGFTLIELLVVIGILAVLMAGVVALIDPVDKNRSAQDSKVQSDVGQLATALQSAAAQSDDGTYPAGLDDLVDLGELTSIPVQPGGADYEYVGGSSDTVTVCGTLTSKKYVTPGNEAWLWSSATGQAGPTTACP